MREFTFYTPTKVAFGRGAEKQAAELTAWAGGSRALVVYGGGSVVKSGLLGRVDETLKAAGIATELLGGVRPNPLLSFARDGVKRAKAFGADIIIAVGGGSAIDTAKAIAIGAANPNRDIWEDFWFPKKSPAQALPVGVVLTISAAGSEMSDSAVLTNEVTKDKRGLSSEWNRPKFAIMNPELTQTLPKNQIGNGVVDILMHTLERYFTVKLGNRLTDEIAEAVMRTVIRCGAAEIENPDDYEAASELMWAGSLSHNGLTGLGGAMDFSVHQLGAPLSGVFDSAHGATLSAMWGDWARYVMPANPARFAELGRKVFGDTGAYDTEEQAAGAAIDRMVEFFRFIGMPVSIPGLGIGVLTDAELQDLAERCSYNRGRVVGNFRPIDRDDMYEIYKAANR